VVVVSDGGTMGRVSRRREIANVKDRKKNEKRCMHEECYIFE
jgi:hypothetical protein